MKLPKVGRRSKLPDHLLALGLLVCVVAGCKQLQSLASPTTLKSPDGKFQLTVPGGWRETAVWSRLALPAGATVEGPAILEQPDATTVIEPGHVGRVDPLGNVIVESR